MKSFFPIASMALIAWSLVAYVIWSVEEAIYWALLSVAVSLLANYRKPARLDNQEGPPD